jgi:hypothetical protein
MPPRTPEDILQAVYDATQEAIRTTVQLILQGDVNIDSVKLSDQDTPARLKIRPDAVGENGAVVILNRQPLPEGAATEAKQDLLIGKDFATELTLQSVLARLVANPATESKQDMLLARDFATETTLVRILAKLITAPATEAKQDALIAKDFATETTLGKIWNRYLTSPPATEAKQDALLTKDFSTETTLLAVLNKLIAAPATEAKQDALLAKDFATETTLSAVLAKLIANPATEAKQDLLIAKDFATESTLAAIQNKLTAYGATEAKQDATISCLVGGTREHREQASVSTSYAALTNSMSFGAPKRHVRIYCEEDMYWVDSAVDDADAAARLTSANQRGFIKRGDKLELSFLVGITRLDFLAVDTAGAVYVTGLE